MHLLISCLDFQRVNLVLLAVLMFLPHDADAIYKCTSARTTSFQEQPCKAGELQTLVRVPHEQPPETALPGDGPGTPVPASAPQQTDQEKLDAMESERLRTEAAYALRDKLAQLTQQQLVCERNYSVVFSFRGDANRTITGAVYPQNLTGELNLAANRCIARVNDLQLQAGAARLQCATRGCK